MRLQSYVLMFALCLSAYSAQANPRTFEQALATAYQKNPALQAGRAGLRAIDEGIAEAQSGWRPSAEARAEIGKSKQTVGKGGVFSGNDTLTPKSVGIVVTQPVFKGFRTVLGTDSARMEAAAGRARLSALEQEILFAGAKAYLDVLEAQKVLELTQGNEKVLEEQLEATRARFDNGEVTKTDVSQAEARLGTAAAVRIQAEGDLANGRAAYSRIIGAVPDALSQPDLSLEKPASLEEAVTLALERHPSLLAAAQSGEAAKKKADMAAGALLPEIDLVARASRGWDQSLMLPGRQEEGAILARATIPLYRSGAEYARVRAARETAAQKRHELEDAREKVREDAVTAWQKLATSRAAIKAHALAVEATQQALAGVRTESQVGTRTTLDILNAEQELLTAKVNLVRARHDESLAILQVKAAIGTLTAKGLDLPVEIYDPREHFEETDGKWSGLTTAKAP